MFSSDGDILGRVNEVDQETEFAPVELFYAKGKANSIDDLTAIAIDSAEIGEKKVVDLLRNCSSDSADGVQRQSVEELNLKMIFYQEGKLNNLTVHFQYEFTQN